MLIEALKNMPGLDMQRAAVFNPGQGHIAVALWRILRPDFIELIGRDLLALRYSRFNLIQNGCPSEKITLSHQVSLASKNKEKSDIIAGVLSEEGQQAILLDTRPAEGGH